TTQPPIPHSIHNFQTLTQQPYTHLILINLSTPITPTYPSPTQPPQILQDIQLHTFHTPLPAIIQATFPIYPPQFLQNPYKPHHIINQLTQIRQHIAPYLILDHLKNLQ
ncbi:DegV family protein, partial [Staphylococcus epidermidis]|uniref:DegV family protein n=1 Tax=Staphylococcus epidermidis TaxID=1282 RepID=UPI00164346DC